MYHLIKYDSGNLYLAKHIQYDEGQIVRVFITGVLYTVDLRVLSKISESEERVVFKERIIFTSENIEEVIAYASLEVL